MSAIVGDALAYKIWDSETNNVLTRSLVRTADPNKGAIPNRCLDPPESTPTNTDDGADSGEEDESQSVLKRSQQFTGGPRKSKRLRRTNNINKTSWIHEDIKDLETRSSAFQTKPFPMKKKVNLVRECWATLTKLFANTINTGTFQPLGDLHDVEKPELDSHELETMIPTCPLQHRAHMAKMQDLQMNDLINEENSEDMTFIPEAILDHRVSKKPRKQITVVTRPDGTTQHQVKVKRIAHVRVKVLWKNGEVTWVQADAMRKQNPFIFLPYVLAKKLQNHKHFAWTKDIIKDPDKIMTALKTSVKKKKEIKFKFGVQVPNNMGQARELDEINNDKQWDGAVQSELRSINGHSTFIVLEEHEPLPDGYTQIPYHFVFDVKFDGRRKARLVAGGHRAPEVDKEESYSGVVGIETIRVAFLLAALNNLDVCADVCS